MNQISRENTKKSSETLMIYRKAKQDVVDKLTWMKDSLNEEQNSTLDGLMLSIETCTDLERNGAFSDGFDAGFNAKDKLATKELIPNG